MAKSIQVWGRATEKSENIDSLPPIIGYFAITCLSDGSASDARYAMGKFVYVAPVARHSD
jgi:hypothetical protein